MGRKYLGNYDYRSFINQFPPNIIRSIRQFERINKQICKQKISIIFNQICINEEMLPIYTYINIYIYTRVYVRVCVCVCARTRSNKSKTITMTEDDDDDDDDDDGLTQRRKQGKTEMHWNTKQMSRHSWNSLLSFFCSFFFCSFIFFFFFFFFFFGYNVLP